MTSFARLVGSEAGRQLRSKVLLLSVAAVLAFRITTTWREMPVWYSVLADMSVSALALGSAVMIVAGTAVLRERDVDMADFLESLPVGKHVRTAALLCASLLVGLLVGTGALALQLATLLVDSVPVGRFGLLEPMTGVATAVLMAGVGVALTSWLPSPVTVPLVIAFVFWTLLQFPDSWLLPVVPDQHLFAAPPRPPASHLLYVVALVVLVAAVALARSRPRWVLLAVGAAVAAVVAASSTLGSPQAHAYEALGDPHQPRTEAATARSTDCRSADGIRYCALPSFTPWVPLWMAAVRPVVHAVPAAERQQLPDVLQELPVGLVDRESAERTAFVPLRWGRNGGEVEFRRQLAGQVAALAVGLPSAKSTDGFLGCRSQGQARVVVALWLLGHVEEPVLPTTEQEYIEDEDGGRQVPVTTSDLGFVSYGRAELELAARLGEVPGMTERIGANWAALTSPRTTVEQAASLLGVRAPASEVDEAAADSQEEACS